MGLLGRLPSFLEKLDPAGFVGELLERGEQELLDLHEELARLSELQGESKSGNTNPGESFVHETKLPALSRGRGARLSRERLPRIRVLPIATAFGKRKKRDGALPPAGPAGPPHLRPAHAARLHRLPAPVGPAGGVGYRGCLRNDGELPDRR